MKRLACMVLTVLVLLMFLTGCGEAETSQAPVENAGTFTLTFITIGKGDAFLLTCPDNSHYLVDTGKAEDYVQIARTLRAKGVETLDGIFATHGHHDHVGCLDTLTGAFPTKEIYYSGKDNVSYTDVLPEEIAKAHGAQDVKLQGGEEMDLGGVKAQIWLPEQVDAQNGNNNSLVLRLTHGNKTFLLMGDAELEEETALMSSGFELRADFLKLGHHGEDDATSPAFLNKVQPSIAFITGNETENPDSVDPMIAQNLTRKNTEFYYSESDGLGIDLISDGNTLTTSTVQDVEFPKELSLSFASVDREAQRVTIRNDGDTTADLTGCLLYSNRGDEHFLFPNGTTLEPGAERTIACMGSEQPDDLVWQQEKVWKKKSDEALLYDRNLNLLAEDDPA